MLRPGPLSCLSGRRFLSRLTPSTTALGQCKPCLQVRRWASVQADDKAGAREKPSWKGKKWEEMTEEEINEYNKTLTYWPYLFVGVILAFVWIPENTKFYWHLRLQFFIHALWWRLVLPREEAETTIREALIGIPAQRRSSQNPLAACPLNDAPEKQKDASLLREAAEAGHLPDGHPGANRPKPVDFDAPIERSNAGAHAIFAQGVVMASQNIKEAHIKKVTETKDA